MDKISVVISSSNTQNMRHSGLCWWC